MHAHKHTHSNPNTRPPRSRSEAASWTIMNEVTKLCYEVAEPDVARARNQLKASLLFAQDSSQSEPAVCV
jgi:hypothetical protein